MRFATAFNCNAGLVTLPPAQQVLRESRAIGLGEGSLAGALPVAGAPTSQNSLLPATRGPARKGRVTQQPPNQIAITTT